jgi:DnaJ-class molecular chaperone
MTYMDFYSVLGVPPSADPDTIRRAYLELVRRLHPDLVGHSGTAHFQAIAEAYETLSDPVKRSDYDTKHGFAHPIIRTQHRPVPTFMERTRPEPLVREPISVLDEPETVHPSFTALYDRIMRNFTAVGVPKSEHTVGFDIGVVLSPREATNGATLRLALPTLRDCPNCGGFGGTLIPCAMCDQTGKVVADSVVQVRIPPLTPDGSVMDVSLDRIGIRNMHLRVHVSVQRSPDIW